MKKLILFLIACIWIIPSQVKGQSAPCLFEQQLTQINSDDQSKSQLEFIDNEIKDKLEFYKSARVTAPNMTTIPVVVYVIHDNKALGVAENISDNQVMSQIAALNGYYANQNLRFCLATKAGTGALPNTIGGTMTQPGIFHVNSTTLTNHFTATDQQAIVNVAPAAINAERYLRIWVVKSINGTSSGILGYSVLPYTSAIFDGIVMRYDAFGDVTNPSCGCSLYPNYDKGKSLAHEVGHYLNLYHIWNGGCSTDLYNGGDKVFDTPPAGAANFSCILGTNSCTFDSNNDDVTNFMDYGNDNCKDHFTTGQKDRIWAALNLYRSTLISTSNQIYTGTCGSENLISGDFFPSTYSACTNTTTVTFTPVVVNQPGASYLWDFGDGTATSNSMIGSHIYNSNNGGQPFIVTLNITYNGSTSSSSAKIYVITCSSINNERNWYFSNSNSFTFANGIPERNDSLPTTHTCGEGSAIVSNASGTTLFYTNGVDIWNGSYAKINTGNPLFGHTSSLDGVVIVPNPNPSFPNQYYIFTKDWGGGTNGFRYSIVNVSGTTVTTGTPFNQAITVAGYDTVSTGALKTNESVKVLQHCNGYYIFTTAFKNNQEWLLVFNLTASSSVPILSHQFLVGNMTSTLQNAYTTTALEVSPDGNTIALSKYFFDLTNLFRFNKFTGQITSNFATVNKRAYNTAFSPDSKLLYFIEAGGVHQYNIANNNLFQLSIPNGSPGVLQLGPDNKIYGNFTNKEYVSAIHNPNNACTVTSPNNCNYEAAAGPRLNTLTVWALPNMLTGLGTTYNNTISFYTQNCYTYTFTPNFCGPGFNWNFGDPASGATNNVSTNTIAQHVFSGEGNFTVTLKDSGNNVLLTIPVAVGFTPPTIQGNSEACLTGINTTNNFITLDPGFQASWAASGGVISGVSNSNEVTINWSSLPGTVTLTLTSPTGCVKTITKTITANCTNACPDTMTLNTTEAVSPATHKAGITIITNGNYLVNSGSTITLRAGNAVIIKPDSTILSGSTFVAKILDCASKFKNESGEESEIRINMEMVLFPNPTRDLATIRLTNGEFNRVTINTIEGRTIFKEKFEAKTEFEFNTGNLKTGIYIVSIETSEGQIISKKLIKE